MNNKDKIGGRAYKNGVKLQNNRKSVKAYYNQKNKLQVEVRSLKKNKYLKYIKKIPVLRGIAILFLAILSFLKEAVKNPKKYWFIFAIILFDLIYIFIPESTSSGIENLFLFAYFSLPVILILIFKNGISDVLKFHGAEHKAVNYYENNYEDNIKSYSRIHRRCGSNIVFYYIIFTFLASFITINLNIFIQELIILGVAYEAIKYTPEKLLFFPTLFQKIVTREPEKKHLKAAEKALEVLTKNY